MTIGAEASLLVDTASGSIRGTELHGVEAFLTIPYATAPEGELRWREPQPMATWDDTLDATELGAACAQPDADFVPGPSFEEDCLTIDVYRPAGTRAGAGLPVMVWIHGGSLTNGSAHYLDGSKMASQTDTIVVMVNYRLGMLSALALPELSQESSLQTSGNFALLDQQAALGWLQTNLDALGGDPDNVTIGGSSAGGESVCMHLASPLSEGLFQRAIIHSGAFDTTLSGQPACATRSAAENEATSLDYVAALGCDGDDRLACLRAVDTQSLIDADAGRVVGYYVDGVALPEPASDAIAAGRWNQVPMMIGTSHDEARGVVAVIPGVGYPLDPALYELIVSSLTGGVETEALLNRYPLDEYDDPAFALAALATDAGFACPSLELQRSMAQFVDVYAWEFNDPDAPPSDFDGFPSGASHASEVRYLFPRTPAVGELTEQQEQLADEMIRLWAAFAADGSPQSDTSPEWPVWQPDAPRTMSLEPGSNRLIDDFAEDHRCDD